MEDLQCKYADITVHPKRMDFVVDEGWKFVPPYQQLWLNKDGTGRSPHWEIEVDADWLRVSHWVGDVPARVRVGCASIDMAAGVYEATITITPVSHVKIDTPEIPVVLTVRPKPQPPEPEPEPEPPPPPQPQPPEPEPPPPPPPPQPQPPEPPNGKACWVCQIIGKVGRAMRRHG